MTLEEQMRVRFERETAEHQLTVLHDDGVYRHLRFRRGESSFYWFDIVTWPGCLSVGGDVDTYVFARAKDMFGWFESSAGGGINPHYWAQKLVAPRGTDGARSYSHDSLRACVHDWARSHADEADMPMYHDVLIDALEREVLYDEWETTWTEQEGRERLEILETEIRAAGGYLETWEWDLREYDWSFLWCCWAIVWGIGQYRAATREAVAA